MEAPNKKSKELPALQKSLRFKAKENKVSIMETTGVLIRAAIKELESR